MTIGNTLIDAELNPLSNHVLKVALAPTYVRICNSFGGRFKFLEVGFLDRSGRKNLKANIVPNFFAWLHTLDIPPTYHAQSAAINFLWSTRQVTKVADHHVNYLSFWLSTFSAIDRLTTGSGAQRVCRKNHAGLIEPIPSSVAQPNLEKMKKM